MPDNNEEQLKTVAAQLRKPEGDYAGEVAAKMNEANAYLNRHTLETLAARSGDYIVEVGMANGRFVSELLGRDASLRYAGCDYSPEMVEAAGELNHSFVDDRRAAFHYAPAHKLPFEAASADILFTVNTIYFWDQPDLVLSEFYRVLKPGGKLVIALRPKRSMLKYPVTRFGFVMYSAAELSTLLSESGFTVSRIIEQEEPGQELAGDSFTVESLIAVAKKPTVFPVQN